jgi:putative tricarboxylic transport membrane protein
MRVKNVDPAAMPIDNDGAATRTGPSRADLIVVGAVTALGVLYTTRTVLDYSFGSLSAPGAALFPAVTGVLLLLGIAGASLGMMMKKTGGAVELDEEGLERDPSPKLGFVGLVGLAALVAYACLLPIVGSAIATLVLTATIAWAAGQRTWWKIASVAVAISLVMQIIFVVVMRMPLPSLFPGWWL